MNCTFNRLKLIEVLDNIKGCIKTNNTIEISSSIYIDVSKEKADIKATDYAMFIKDSIKPVEVKENGSMIIPFNVFYRLIKNSSSDDIKLKTKNNSLELTSNKSSYKIPIINEVFPEGYKVDSETTLEVYEEDIKEVFSRFIRIIPDSSHNNACLGLNIKIKEDNTVDFVATDTYRLYIKNYNPININGINNVSFVVPKEMINYLQSVLEYSNSIIKINLNSSYIEVVKGDMVVKHQLISDTYPHYEKIIPKKMSYKVDVNTETFKRAINRIKIMSEFALGDNVVKIKTNEDNVLHLYTSDMKNIENTELELNYQIEKDLDYNWLLDYVNSVKKEEFSIYFEGDRMSPLLLNDGSVSYMMMPVINSWGV